MKKWDDLNKLIDKDAEKEMHKELLEYFYLMKQKPNFDKTEGAKSIFERKEYIILQVKKGYVVYNRNKPFENGHSHLRSFRTAKTIIDNCIKKKMPKTSNIYLLSSHVRISNDDKFIRMIEELVEAKRDKDKMKYINNRL